MAGVGGGVPPHAVVRSKQLRRMPDVYPGRLSMCDIMGEASNPATNPDTIRSTKPRWRRRGGARDSNSRYGHKLLGRG